MKKIDKRVTYYFVSMGKYTEDNNLQQTLYAPDDNLEHHNILKRIRPNDIILYATLETKKYEYYKIKCISGIGRVKEIRKKNKDLYVDTDYTPLNEPIKLKSLDKNLIKSRGPFDINGNLKQQYCNQLDNELVYYLFEKICEKNPELSIKSFFKM